MAYGTPTDPVGGTVITVAYAVANLLDPIRWLRGLTGNADPPGSNYVVRSINTTSTEWSKVTSDMLASGAVTDAKLATAKLSLTGGTMSGILIFSDDGDGVQLSQGSLITDFSGDGLTMYADSSKFRIMREGTSTEILSADYAAAAPLFKGQVMYHAGNLPAAGAAVPSGLIAAFATAAAIASGWARYTALDGRVPVGAGTTFTVTYTEDTDYGSGWSHNHDMASHTHTGPSHSHSAAALGVSGSTGGPSSTNTTGSTGNTSADGGHTHNEGSLDVTGTTDAGGTGATGVASPSATGNTAWAIPSHAVVWAQKS